MPEGTINYYADTTRLGSPWLNICRTCSKSFGQKRCHKTGRTPSLCQSSKKGSKREFFSYCGINLFFIAGKVLTTIIRSSVTSEHEVDLRVAEASFQKGQGWLDKIFNLCQIFGRCIRNGQGFGCVFLYFAAAFNLVHKNPFGLGCWLLVFQKK